MVELFFVCKVLWADGRKSWLREENLPVKVKNKVIEGERDEQQLMSLREMRQDRLQLMPSNNSNTNSGLLIFKR